MRRIYNNAGKRRFTVSCGTEDGSDSFENADKSAIKAGSVIHFDFAGDKAESTERADIEYSICIYDKELNILSTKSFVDDFPIRRASTSP